MRYGLALIMHFSNFTMITQRVSLSIAIIAMVNSTQHQDPANVSTEDPLTDPLSNRSRSIKDFSARVSAMERRFLMRENSSDEKEARAWEVSVLALLSMEFNCKLQEPTLFFEALLDAMLIIIIP